MHCVITGAASGIGLSLAREFCGQGARVTAVDVDGERAEQMTCEVGDVRVLSHDLSQDAGVDACCHDLLAGDRVDVLIHNAGISAVGWLPSIDLEEQQRVIDLNLTAPTVLTARVLGAKHINSGGSLVFVSSLSRYVGYPGASVYAATKDGIASYARSLRVELKAEGIDVLTVFPGPTRTAHARKYSPDNSREHTRMDPDVLARKVVKSVRGRKRQLIPGFQNKVLAALGSCFPAASERVMVRAILGRIDPAEGAVE